MKTTTLPRREFLKVSMLSGAVLALGYTSLEGEEISVIKITQPGALGLELNPYIFIEASGKITIFNHRPEMGQGTFQSIPMILAEELEVALDKVEIVQAPANRAKYGDQMVVGSASIQRQFAPLRKIGAAAREMLIQAAANRWKVSVD